MHIDEDEEEGICTYIENGILVERKLNYMVETELKPKWQPKNINEYLFYNEVSTLGFDF